MKKINFISFNKSQHDLFLIKLTKISNDNARFSIERSYIGNATKESLEGFTHFLNYNKSIKKGVFSKFIAKKPSPQKSKRRYLIEGYMRLGNLSFHHSNFAAQHLLTSAENNSSDFASSYIYLYHYNYLKNVILRSLREENIPSPTLSYREWREPIFLLFLSLIFEKVSPDEIIVNYINRVEDSGVIRYGAEDMPYFQFSRWLMLYTLTKKKPVYKIKSALFSSIIDSWDNNDLFLQSIINILNHHLAECMEIRKVEQEHTRYYGDRPIFIGLWEENHVIPLEVLALRQLRLTLGLYWPEKIDHPLMFDGLYEMVDKAKAQVDSLNNELLETIQKVLESDDIPSKAEIVHAINTVPLYEPEDDDW